LFALVNGQNGDLFVQKSPAARVDTIVGALSLLMRRNDVTVNNIGIRPGEKIHETLLSAEERAIAIEHSRYFQVPRGSHLSISNLPQCSDYTSENTSQLSVTETADLLSKIPSIKPYL
jgi:UDP-glucose 4-epimerase